MEPARTSTAVAVGQFAPGSDTAGNLRSMRDLAATAASRGARMVVFPEYSAFFRPELGPEWVDAAETIHGRFAAGVQAMAKVLGIYVVAGMLECSADPARFFNTLIAVDPSGSLVASYRKLHLYDAFGQRESDFVVAGPIETPETFVVDGLTIGMQTCYDVRFPEATRRLLDVGVEVVVIPAAWVRGPLKEHHWRTLVTARAIENTVYVAAADHAPPIGAGNSMIVDPMGIELVTIGEEEDVAVAWLSRDRIDRVRDVNPALAMRRFAVVERHSAGESG